MNILEDLKFRIDILDSPVYYNAIVKFAYEKKFNRIHIYINRQGKLKYLSGNIKPLDSDFFKKNRRLITFENCKNKTDYCSFLDKLIEKYKIYYELLNDVEAKNEK